MRELARRLKAEVASKTITLEAATDTLYGYIQEHGIQVTREAAQRDVDPSAKGTM